MNSLLCGCTYYRKCNKSVQSTLYECCCCWGCWTVGTNYLLKVQQPSEIFSNTKLPAYPECENLILFQHTMIGCDTSAMFRRGETPVSILFEN